MVGRDLGEDVQEAGVEHAVHMYPARVHAVEQRGEALQPKNMLQAAW